MTIIEAVYCWYGAFGLRIAGAIGGYKKFGEYCLVGIGKEWFGLGTTGYLKSFIY